MNPLPEGDYPIVVEYGHGSMKGVRLMIDRDGVAWLDGQALDPAVALWLFARAWRFNVPPTQADPSGHAVTVKTSVGIYIQDARP